MGIEFLNFEAFHSPIRDEMVETFKEIYDSNSLILGEHLNQFERNYATLSSTDQAIGVSNGLDALFLSLKSLGIGKGDEVIVPSNTYIATVLAVSYTGAKPVFAEPDTATYNLDPNNLENAITPKTRAVIPVHLYGQACEMDSIVAVANNHDLYVIEDNAQAHGAKFLSKPTGSWGVVNATSFYPTKNLGALGDAGAVTTDDNKLAQKIRILRNYGSSEKYINKEIGYNKRLDELQAAFLNIKMKYLKKWTAQRQVIAGWYNDELNGIGDLILPQEHPNSTHVYHLYVIRTGQREGLQKYLKKHDIGTLIHYPIPPHLQRAYSELNYKKGAFPVAEQLANEVLSIPIWPGMSEEQADEVIREIKQFF
ncbi:DegT/DnrJ/EryC1/StrS family aminotransferase [Balneolaceae bacterium YR4-1]|uniref:DegT/DnrJ/EryC1/StrS family aminotransferase n=1 Tax=Halalkalibaculum roseum TaxID=2709311 RepID=A0A6M1T3Y0_9BACT|nr:DegT/DnrJ/EryC1/StrS family aminotransferase [Halalkalibaculum roseum]NGP76695.1 DegT/DnrJ/EryC1/StrS family aminotransferase [Halalkalibaculum roseum]